MFFFCLESKWFIFIMKKNESWGTEYEWELGKNIFLLDSYLNGEHDLKCSPDLA